MLWFCAIFNKLVRKYANEFLFVSKDNLNNYYKLIFKYLRGRQIYRYPHCRHRSLASKTASIE